MRPSCRLTRCIACLCLGQKLLAEQTITAVRHRCCAFDRQCKLCGPGKFTSEENEPFCREQVVCKPGQVALATDEREGFLPEDQASLQRIEERVASMVF